MIANLKFWVSLVRLTFDWINIRVFLFIWKEKNKTKNMQIHHNNWKVGRRMNLHAY